MAYDGLGSVITMAIVSAPCGDGAWPTLIKTSPTDCRKGCWSIPHVKVLKWGAFCVAIVALLGGSTHAIAAVAVFRGDGICDRRG